MVAVCAGEETVRAVVEARARSGVETHAVLRARRVMSARAFHFTCDADESLIARTGSSGARAVSVSAAWVGRTARANCGAVRFDKSGVALALASVGVTDALSGTHNCGSFHCFIKSRALELARVSGVTTRAAALTCTDRTAVAVSVIGADHRSVVQHAGTGPCTADPKPARWAPGFASHLALDFALLAAPRGFIGVAQTAVEALALKAAAVDIANESLGARGHNGARDSASAAIVLCMATVANGTVPESVFGVLEAGA